MLRTFTCIMCPQGCEITAEGNETPYVITETSANAAMNM